MAKWTVWRGKLIFQKKHLKTPKIFDNFGCAIDVRPASTSQPVECVVMAGEIVMSAAAEAGVNVLPVDSEHNAIFQCLEGNSAGADAVRRLLLTASQSSSPFSSSASLVSGMMLIRNIYMLER